MPKTRTLCLSAALALMATFASTGVTAQSAPGDAALRLKLPFEKYTLQNGMEVVLHEDRRTPVVALNLWYHVGSKDEAPGKNGFAHLFEHLMFQGSRNVGEDQFFKYLEDAGASDRNGTTNYDRTNYFETVPANQLALGLWLESDRMGFLLDHANLETFDSQREVVKNERRQNYENAPYGLVRQYIRAAIFPESHPYHRLTIGTPADLDAASLDDVRAFFRRYYVPNNATLVLAGDIDRTRKRALWSKSTSRVCRAARIRKRSARRCRSPWPPKRASTSRRTSSWRGCFVSWPTPPRFKPGDRELDFLGLVLASGKSSRLYKKLVYELQIAQDVAAIQESSQLASTFEITVTVRKGKDPKQALSIVDEELAKLRTTPPSQAEVERARARLLSSLIFGMERVTARANSLNEYNQMTGDPGYFERDLAGHQSVQPKDVSAAAAQLASRRPARGDAGHAHRRSAARRKARRTEGGPEPRARKRGHGEAHRLWSLDDSRARSPRCAGTPRPPPTPVPGPAPSILPQPAPTTRRILSQASSRARPRARVRATEDRSKRGWATAFACFWSSATSCRSSRSRSCSIAAPIRRNPVSAASWAQCCSRARKRGQRSSSATRSTRSAQTTPRLPTTTPPSCARNVLSSKLGELLPIFADVAAKPGFFAGRDRARAQEASDHHRSTERRSVVLLANAVGAALYPAQHAYGWPLLGDEPAVKKITRQKLAAFHSAQLKPEALTLTLAGDVAKDRAIAELERVFGGLKGQATERKVPVDPASKPQDSRIVIIDRPGAAQSNVSVALVGVARSTPDFDALTVMNTLFGGKFSSRLNLNLREKHAYTYGAGSGFAMRHAAGPFTAGGAIVTKATGPAIREILRELERLRSEPVSESELADAKANLIRQLPARFETAAETAASVGYLAIHGLPLDEYATRPRRFAEVTREDVQAVARRHLVPRRYVSWWSATLRRSKTTSASSVSASRSSKNLSRLFENSRLLNCDVVRVKSAVGGDDRNPFDLRLRDQESIEGVCVMRRQAGGAERVQLRHRQRRRRALLHARRHVLLGSEGKHE